jgi:chromosome segregation protein
MYLKRLEIHGFKTFAEKTQVVFTPGITCVIGPNGSGKSNIADALLWVLGENNVRSLRGSTSQDVIFAGNDRRRPLGMAEVSLTLDNSARILPLDFSEITVTRRLYRSGESECSINRVSCRLRDIYELFLDTGLGRDAYAMIGQGEIDQILSVRSEDRRAIFEEAAGIKKYRVRKREAERKLEHTAQNLLRVNDIIAELEAQLGPLQRQAAAARRHRELSGRLRVLEDAWYGAKLKRLDAERHALKALVEDLKAERGRLEQELTGAQEAEQSGRDELQRLEERAHRLRGEETAALQRVAGAEREKARAEERLGEAQRRLQTLARELDDLAGRIREQVGRSQAADREEAELKRQVDLLRGELASAQEQARERGRAYEAAAADLERKRQSWVERARRQAEAEARLQALEARVQSLEQGRKRAEAALADGEADLARLLLERESFQQGAAELKKATAALAGELETLRERARIAEARLADARSQGDATARARSSHQARLQALSELGERGEGAAAGARKLLEAARRGQAPGTWSRLVDGLRVPEGLEKAVEAALGIYGDALLCDSEEHALAAMQWLRAQKAVALVLPGGVRGQWSVVSPQGEGGSEGVGEGERGGDPGTEAAATDNARSDSVDSGDSVGAGKPVRAGGLCAFGSRDFSRRAYEEHENEGGTRLAPLVDGEGPALDWARLLLRGAVLADSLEAAAGERATLLTGADQPTPTPTPFPPLPLSPIHPSTHPPIHTPILWVTREGHWLALSGAMSSGASGAEGAAAATLARTREVERLREEAPALESAAGAARDRVRAAEEEARRAHEELREKQSEAERARLEHQAQLREGERRNGEAERARHRAERLRQEVARTERDHAAAADSLRREGDRERKPEEESEDQGQAGIVEAQTASGKLELARREAENAVTELRVRLAQGEQRLQGAAGAARRMAEAGASLDRQRAERIREQRALVEEQEGRRAALGKLDQEAGDAARGANEARAALASLAEQSAARTAALNELRTRSQDLGNRLRELMERAHRVEVELAALDAQWKHLGQQWLDAALQEEGERESSRQSAVGSRQDGEGEWGSGGAGETQGRRDAGTPGRREPVSTPAHGHRADGDQEPPALTVERLLAAWDPAGAETVLSSSSDPEAEIGRLRRQIRSLGAVNLEAVEQHARARERFDFLTSQRADLDAAREQLERAIQEIDAASRETFMRAFREIATAFDEMFKKLFGGGATELRLTDPDDVLETGIDVIVQPPGKKQQNLLLLSGGERALTAAAMLFALLKVRPSPFCVMDEVDAPLDESNVGRFTSVLRDFAGKTQFIVVTHNRGTMESADTLYGITMEERGVSKVLSCSLDDTVVAQVEAEQHAGAH